MLTRTPVLVLHRYAYSESSWIVKALSQDFGVLSLLVKGAKSKDSPFHNSLDPLSHAEVLFNHSPRKELFIPREASLIQWFGSLRSRLADLALAQAMAEILLRLSTVGGHFVDEYHLLYDALCQLEAGPADAGLFARWLRDLSAALGYGISLESCVQCGQPLRPLPADVWPALGGGICTSCLGLRSPAYSPSFIGELQSFLQGESLEAKAYARIEHFYLHFLRQHTGALSTLHSLDWLAQARNLF